MATLNRNHELTKSQSIIKFPFVWIHNLKCVKQEPQYFSFTIFTVCPVVLPLILCLTRARCTSPYPPPTNEPVLQNYLYSEIVALRQVKGYYVGSTVCLF